MKRREIQCFNIGWASRCFRALGISMYIRSQCAKQKWLSTSSRIWLNNGWQHPRAYGCCYVAPSILPNRGLSQYQSDGEILTISQRNMTSVYFTMLRVRLPPFNFHGQSTNMKLAAVHHWTWMPQPSNFTKLMIVKTSFYLRAGLVKSAYSSTISGPG